MAQCHLTWDSYKQNICEGFSYLQQQQELVDMTLAAEGHLVKVHKSLLALASPYLKSIIQSAPCQHPVVFLTHLNHKILGYILEFVYSGEVALPMDDITDFIEAAKALHISGACDLIPPTKFQQTETQSRQNKHSDMKKVQGKKNIVNNRFYVNMNEEDSLKNIEDNQDINVEDIVSNRHSNQTNLTCQTVVDFEDFIENTPICHLPSQNNTGKNIVNNTETLITSEDIICDFPVSHNKVFNISQSNELNPKIDTLTRVELDSEIENSQIQQSGPEDDDNMDMDDESMSFQYSSKKPFEAVSDTNMVKLQSDQKNNYSINVEMPAGNKGPPKITIQAGAVEKLPSTSHSVSNKRVQSAGKEKTISVSNNDIPEIILVQDEPYTSSTKDDNTTLTNPDTTKSADNICGSSSSSPFYILSSKGSIQIILNRFLYGLHHRAKQGKKIRWRCVDYRHQHCPAFIDTSGEVIVTRKFAHNHPFHDNKIMNRGSTKKIYESLAEISRALEDKQI